VSRQRAAADPTAIDRLDEIRAPRVHGEILFPGGG